MKRDIVISLNIPLKPCGRVLLALFILFASTSNAQTPRQDTAFFSSTWKVCDRDTATFYRTGTKRINGLYAVTDRYMNGVTQMSGTLSSMSPDVNEGHCLYYNPAGALIADEIYKAGKLDGKLTRFFAGTRRIKSEETYLKNKRNGTCRYYDSLSGGLVGVFHYKAGTSVDTSKTYTSTGKTTMVISPYRLGLRMKISYDTSGYKISEGGIDSTGRKTGLWKTYYRYSDKIEYESHYIRDTIDGPACRYDFACNTRLYSGAFRQGKADGMWLYYNSCDTIISTRVEKRGGLMSGQYLKYDPASRMVVREGMIRAGQNIGRWVSYFRGSTTPSMISNYENGKYEGELTTFFPDGTIRRKETYRDGVMMSWQCFGRSGKDTIYYKRYTEATYPYNFQDILKHRINYPLAALQENLSGQVVVKIYVDDDSRIYLSEVQKSSNRIFNNEALRVAESLPILSPAMNDGEMVGTSLLIKLDFKPEDAEASGFYTD